MDNKPKDPGPTLPVANYSSAIARAVDWLGDRYLLARPINASRNRATRGLVHRPGEGRA
jgi:hypothetical protein